MGLLNPTGQALGAHGWQVQHNAGGWLIVEPRYFYEEHQVGILCVEDSLSDVGCIFNHGLLSECLYLMEDINAFACCWIPVGIFGVLDCLWGVNYVRKG